MNVVPMAATDPTTLELGIWADIFLCMQLLDFARADCDQDK